MNVHERALRAANRPPGYWRRRARRLWFEFKRELRDMRGLFVFVAIIATALVLTDLSNRW